MLFAFPPGPPPVTQVIAWTGLVVIFGLYYWGVWSNVSGAPRPYDGLLYTVLSPASYVWVLWGIETGVFQTNWDWIPVVTLGLSVTLVVGSLCRFLRRGAASPGHRGTFAGLTIVGIFVGWLILDANASIAFRERGYLLECKNNVSKIAEGLLVWSDDRGQLPGSNVALPGQPPLSWRVDLLPHLAPGWKLDAYDRTQPWDSAANRPAAATPPSLYVCPSAPRPSQSDAPYLTSYALVTGPGTAIPGPRGLSLEEIGRGDGTTMTMLVAEACGQNIIWTEPRDIDVRTVSYGMNVPGDSPDESPGLLSSYHVYRRRSGDYLPPSRFHFATASGMVYAVSPDIDPEVLRALTTANGEDWRVIADGGFY